MILAMDGFDAQIWPPIGLDTGGEQDQGALFGSIGTSGTFALREGYQEGRAALMYYNETLGWANSTYSTDWVDGTDTTLVFDAWFIGDTKRNGDQAGYSNLIKIGRGTSYYIVGFSASGNNTALRLGTDTSSGGAGTVTWVSSPSSAVAINQWFHLRFVIDILTGAMTLYRNGALLLSGTGWVQVAWGGAPSFIFNSPLPSATRTWDIGMDHCIVYNAIPTANTYGYGIQVIADRYESGSEFQGVWVAANSSYKTIGQGALISSSSVGDENRGNTRIYMYPENPATLADWQAGEFEAGNWGVCNIHSGSPATVRNRLCSLLLYSFVYSASGPTLTWTTPGVLTYFDGNWAKTDEALSWAGHLQAVPRDNNGLGDTAFALRDATDYLTVYGNGCILFGVAPPPPVGFPIGITFAEERRADHSDWNDILGDGIDYESYFISGYGIFGQGDKKFQSNYVTVNYENLGTDAQIGGATIQGVWDYSLNGDTGRWSSKQQVYGPRSDLNYKHSRSRVKIRGHGTSLQMRVASVGDDPFAINGWTVYVTGNTSV